MTGDKLVEVRGAGFTTNELEWSATWIDPRRPGAEASIPANEVPGVVVAVGFGTSGYEVYGLTDSNRDGAAAASCQPMPETWRSNPPQTITCRRRRCPRRPRPPGRRCFDTGRSSPAGQWW